MAVTKGATAYFGIKISGTDNLVMTPEGYLWCKNAVIARTGFQEYKGNSLKDLQDEFQAMNITLESESIYNIFRPEDEVFSVKTIASFEGKPVTLRHPDELLDVDTVEMHARGHMQNVRRGDEPLEDGNWPLLADIMVINKELAEKILNGLRELSCGYNYHITKRGETLCQYDIRGNHVAIVEEGRAGPLARILDSADVRIKIMEKVTMSKAKGLLQALGIISLVKSDKPVEEVQTALEALIEDGKKPVAMDEKQPKAQDADEDRKRFHSALDKMLDSKDKEQAAQDADLDALRSLFESPSAEATRESGADSADPEEDEEEEAEATDEAVESESAPELSEAERPRSPAPGAVDAADIVTALKPFIAQIGRTGGVERLKKAFDSLERYARGRSKAAKGSYSDFARSARTPGAKANDAIERAKETEQSRADKINAAYQARKGKQVTAD